jgi:hypothetical protein
MNGVSVQMKLAKDLPLVRGDRVQLLRAPHGRRPDRATLLLMNEALPGKGILRSSVTRFQCKYFPLERPP